MVVVFPKADVTFELDDANEKPAELDEPKIELDCVFGGSLVPNDGAVLVLPNAGADENIAEPTAFDDENEFVVDVDVLD